MSLTDLLGKSILLPFTVMVLAFAGCKKDESGHYIPTNTDIENPVEFSQFGYVKGSYEMLVGDTGITSADFDGDGDIDIAVVDGSGRMYIYENKMPQTLKQPFR